MDDDLLEDFLDELAALRAFIARRPQRSSFAAADPDVLRLVEALAFFTVHTRRTATRNLDTAWRRLVSQDFGYLMTPLPASGLVRAIGMSPLFPAARTLPRGTAFQLKARSSRARFSATSELGDLRNVLADVKVSRGQDARGQDRRRLAIELEPGVPRRDAPGTISLFVHPRDDYAVSLELLEQIRRNVRGVRAAYTGTAGVAPEVECRLAVGARAVDESVHPLARLRSFFHDPRQELFLHLTPAAPPIVWTRLTIFIEVDPVLDLSRLDASAVCSHVLPVVNQRRAFARPIKLAGARSAEPVVPLDAEPGTDVHSILGVYQTRGDDLVPLRSGALGLGVSSTGLGGGWEPERGDDGRMYVTLRNPEAFAAPATLAVEALWHQPGWVDQTQGQPIEPCVPDRHLEGVSWQMVGPLQRDEDSARSRGTSELFDLLGLRSRPVLGLDELRWLLEWLVPASSVYRDQIPRILDLDSQLAMELGPRGSGVARRYTLTFAPGRAGEEALGTVFLGKVRALLLAWSADARVTFTAISGGVPMALTAA